jgi:ABC-type transporter Mla subunit MlaD
MPGEAPTPIQKAGEIARIAIWVTGNLYITDNFVQKPDRIVDNLFELTKAVKDAYNILDTHRRDCPEARNALEKLAGWGGVQVELYNYLKGLRGEDLRRAVNQFAAFAIATDDLTVRVLGCLRH